MKFPVGPRTIEKAAKTEAGKLAAALNRVLYSADNADVMLKSGYDGKGVDKFDVKARRYVCQDKVFRNDDPLPPGVSPCGNDGKYFETEQLMHAIRDFLESAAIREVCD
jgi:hypothetical protein